ncbi:hypothetical protein INR49_026250 [Caranx melampygus]|nr:hypothetical protein INR49_026250 [Caranx melampygus]
MDTGDRLESRHGSVGRNYERKSLQIRTFLLSAAHKQIHIVPKVVQHGREGRELPPSAPPSDIAAASLHAAFLQACRYRCRLIPQGFRVVQKHSLSPFYGTIWPSSSHENILFSF